MRTFRTELPCKPIRESWEITNSRDAAILFANRYARRLYGKRGYCHHVRVDHWTQNGKFVAYEAFIGVPAEGGGTSGRNVFLTVTVEE